MATVNIFLDKRKCDVGFGIIKIRITEKRIQRDYSSKIKVPIGIYEKLILLGKELDGRIKDPLLVELHKQLFAEKDDINIFSDGFVLKSKNIIKKMGDNFSFEKFKEELENYGKEVSKNDNSLDLIKALREKSQKLLENEQITHGNNFSQASKSILRFINHDSKPTSKQLDSISFDKVTDAFLRDWSKYMSKFGKASQKLVNGIPSKFEPASNTTIAIYSRAIKTVFLEIIDKGLMPKDSYPFGNRKFIIPEAANNKKALNDAQLNLLKSYKPEPHSMEERSLDLWLFSYLGNGLNFADLLRLKWKNLNQDKIQFIRQKTKRKPVVITVRVNETMKAILDRQANTVKNKETYIFPFLVGITGIEKEKNTIHQIIKSTNLYMNKIAKTLNIDVSINTYEARHSFASKLMRSDAPLKMISEKLGHKKLSTTEAYLGSFSKEEEDKYLDLL
jgi:integrase